MSQPKKLEDLNEDILNRIVGYSYTEGPFTTHMLGNISKAFRSAVSLTKSKVLQNVIPTTESFKNTFKLLLKNSPVSESKIERMVTELDSLITDINDFESYESHVDDYDEDKLAILNNYSPDTPEFAEVATEIRTRIIDYTEKHLDKIKTIYESLLTQDPIYIYKLGVLYYTEVILLNEVGKFKNLGLPALLNERRDEALVKSIEFHKAYLVALLMNKKHDRTHLKDTIAFIGNYKQMYKFPSKNIYEDKILKLYMYYMYSFLKPTAHSTFEKLYYKTPSRPFVLPKTPQKEIEVFTKAIEYFFRHPTREI